MVGSTMFAVSVGRYVPGNILVLMLQILIVLSDI
jgi:hypothetical protein